MIQYCISKDIHEALNDGNSVREVECRKKRCNNLKGCLRVKWKLLISLLILMFVLTGIVLYINNQTSLPYKGKVNVHIIPYISSGWHPEASTQSCFEHDLQESFNFMLDELESDNKRRLTISEMFQVWGWWKTQGEGVRRRFAALVESGRIEIAGGGWCAADEALVHYRAFIDQFTLGLRRLEEIAGRAVAPDVCFLIDNRGHSGEIASLLGQMGFGAVVLGGISPREQCRRKMLGKMDFLWLGDGDFDDETKSENPNIYASILDEKALKINSHLSRENLVMDVEEFVGDVFCQRMGYGTNNIFIPVGGACFQFNNFRNIFRLVDSLMGLTRSVSNINFNVIYSTPSEYVGSVLSGDGFRVAAPGKFLPYDESKNEYWTGYYSSRPGMKYLERKTSGFVEVFKQILCVADGEMKYTEQLSALREAVGLCQHHKGVMGISSQRDADYLSGLLCRALGNATEAVSSSLNKITRKEPGVAELSFDSCPGLNVSECGVTEESERFIVTVYNPSSRHVDHYVRVPVARDEYEVRTGKGGTVPVQIVRIRSGISKAASGGGRELVFRATEVPPLGFRSFYVSAVAAAAKKRGSLARKSVDLRVSNTTGKIEAILRDGKAFPFSQELVYYPTTSSSRNSVFKPRNVPVGIGDRPRFRLVNDGDLVTEYEQVFESWALQLIRIYKEEEYVEFKWVVGPIPFSFLSGKEIVSRFVTTIRNGEVFHSDDNGRGSKKRKRMRESDFESTGDRTARNYRPVSSHISIWDADSRLHVFNDRAQGGTSAFDGELELMVHRRLVARRLLNRGEDLNEEDQTGGSVAAGQHWVFAGPARDPKLRSEIEKFEARSHWEPWLFFANASAVSYHEWRLNYVTEFSALNVRMPRNLRILTLEPWRRNQMLLRLENAGRGRESAASVNLQALFSGFSVTGATEVALAGSGPKRPAVGIGKLSANPVPEIGKSGKLAGFEVSVGPAEIRTFVIDVEF